jgi:hypothetical protein
MNNSRHHLVAAVAGLAVGAWASSAVAQTNTAKPNAAPSKITGGVIADNDSIYIDATSFTVTPGKGKNDTSVLVNSLGARDLGPGAIVFRSGDKLYILNAPILASRTGDKSLYVTAETARPNRINIEYRESKNPDFQEAYDIIRKGHGLETMQQVLAPLVLPEPITIRAKDCGMVNAWYIREDGKPVINICYDYLAEILKSLPANATRAGLTRQDAAAGQFFWLVTHETGHAVFDIFGVPIMGHEENAADNFASYIMLRFGKSEARRLIGGAAWAYHEYISDYRTNREVQFRLAGFSSDHGQPEERFYSLMCLAFGADQQTFGDLVQDGWLPPSRAPNCAREYQKLTFAFRKDVSPHIDQDLARKVHDTDWLPVENMLPPPTAPPTQVVTQNQK